MSGAVLLLVENGNSILAYRAEDEALALRIIEVTPMRLLARAPMECVSLAKDVDVFDLSEEAPRLLANQRATLSFLLAGHERAGNAERAAIVRGYLDKTVELIREVCS